MLVCGVEQSRHCVVASCSAIELNNSLRVWLWCADLISYKEEERPRLGGRALV